VVRYGSSRSCSIRSWSARSSTHSPTPRDDLSTPPTPWRSPPERASRPPERGAVSGASPAAGPRGRPPCSFLRPVSRRHAWARQRDPDLLRSGGGHRELPGGRLEAGGLPDRACGYAFTYWLGVRARLRRHARTPPA
jgi:hypothetical protein